MSTKFVECVLGVKYRNENPDGSVSGGPMYYLRKGFRERGMDRFGKFIGAFYAVGIFIGALGCMVQLGPLLDISDAFVFLICVPNILGMYFLAPIVKREFDDYAARLKAGKIKKFKNV